MCISFINEYKNLKNININLKQEAQDLYAIVWTGSTLTIIKTYIVAPFGRLLKPERWHNDVLFISNQLRY